jgi:hypothetical protein
MAPLTSSIRLVSISSGGYSSLSSWSLCGDSTESSTIRPFPLLGVDGTGVRSASSMWFGASPPRSVDVCEGVGDGGGEGSK